ncbi:MAG: hypothetical protein WCO06_04125 [Candidatus Roizmanbacteria bacterium]
MLPLIIVESDEQKRKEYINDFILQNSIKTYAVSSILPEKTEITIDQSRSVIKDLKLQMPYKRLFVFYSFDLANNEAQNSLLKTFEEQSVNNCFIMFVANSNLVLPTIRSRSTLIIRSNRDLMDKKETSDISEYLLQIYQNSLPIKISYVFLSGVNRERSLEICDALLFFLRSRMIDNKPFLVPLIKRCIETRQLIISNNLNPQLAVDSIFLFWIKLQTV